jgi:A/G-specific adenine glycosylase
MLQQTQVTRVLEKYTRFLRRFPTLRALAEAERRDVLVEWRGMGYNSRAVRLHTLARTVVETDGARIRPEIESLMKLPGIGRYTAHAVLSFAFRRAVPVVDTNVRRVVSRLFWRRNATTGLAPERAVWNLAARLLPISGAHEWNQALMDLGATVCMARKALCGECPVRRFCASAGRIRSARPEPGRREPSFRGIPNRIHRGRLVEILRSTGKRPIALNQLGKRLYPDFSRSHHRWLATILSSLERDGLVRISGDGPALKRGVTLA